MIPHNNYGIVYDAQTGQVGPLEDRMSDGNPAKMIVDATKTILDQQKQLADLQRQNELLRAVAEAAHEHLEVNVCDVDTTDEMWAAWNVYTEKRQAAIGGGAITPD